MPIPYAAALRMLAKERGHFVLPRKGSEDYERVRKLMTETTMSSEHEVKRRSKKAKTVLLEADSSDDEVKRVAAPPPMKNDTKLIDTPGMEKVSSVVEKPMEKPIAQAKGGVKRTGRTKAQQTKDFLINDNTGPSSVITTENPDQKKALKKYLKKGDTPLTSDPKPNPPEATIDMMNKEAKGKSLDGGATQFSFIEFRKKLLC